MLFRPLKMGRNFVFGSVLVFFVFHAKSATTNNHPTGLRDTLFYSPFSCNSNMLTKSKKKVFPSVEKNRFDFLDFCQISSG